MVEKCNLTNSIHLTKTHNYSVNAIKQIKSSFSFLVFSEIDNNGLWEAEIFLMSSSIFI